MIQKTKHFYEFGAYRVDPANRLLWRGGEIISLPPKSFDLLLALVEESGQVLTKEELMRRVWQDSFVEEANLSNHVFTLRKALGEDKNGTRYIETIPRRGYRFVASVTDAWGESDEMILAERTQSRVVIEQEEEPVVKAMATPAEPLPAHTPSRNKTRINWQRRVVGACIIVIGLGLIAYFLISGRTNREPAGLAIHSIAILPFKLIGTESGDEYLGIGLTDALIMRFGNLKKVIVRPTNAVAKYNVLGQDPILTGRELKVDAVLDGTIQRVGDRMRVNVQLVKVDDGTHLWADKFDEKFTDLFAVQDRLSEKVTAALALKLTGEERKQLTRRYTDNTEAYRLALIARYHWNKWTGEDFKKAIQYCELAIEKDPNYAPAYAYMGQAYQVLGNFGILSPAEANTKAKQLAEKALTMDDDFDNAYYVLAATKLFYDWDWSGVEAELKRAIALNPNNTEGRMLYVYYLMITGRADESVMEARRCEELDPVSAFVSMNVGDMLYFARRYDEAIAQYRRTLELDSHYADAHYGLGYTYMETGMREAALREINTGVELDGSTREASFQFAYACARLGKIADARAILSRLEQSAKQRYVDTGGIARIYEALGEKDRALEWLENAYTERRSRMIWLSVDPRWDSLRSEPRFASLLRRIGLSQ